jgi:3-methyladenine DNA glycosylase AlkD
VKTARNLQSSLEQLANPQQARILQRFFKTQKGGYGEGDRFLGIKVPEQRKIARKFSDLPLGELVKAIRSPWHECRLTAVLILVHQYSHGDEKLRDRIFRTYLKHLKFLNNWDLIDTSAGLIVGGHLFERDCKLLYELAASKKWTERRTAVIATSYFLVRGKFEHTLKLSRILLTDDHDLIHKATGWMLREVGKRDALKLRGFLDRYAPEMPRTMLRYAIEKFPPEVRRFYLGGPRRGKKTMESE